VGGSRTYVASLAQALGARVRSGDAAVAVRRRDDAVEVRTASGRVDAYDHVILATHSDEALRLLETPTPAEQALLAAIRYAPNTAYLHRDARLMPRRRAAWASWNYLRGRGGDQVCVSYCMNMLQNIDAQRPLFVTLNPAEPPDPAKTFGAFAYDHPQFDLAALHAQRAMADVQGKDRISFAGAWLGYGFHEDGLASGLRAAEALGGAAPWFARGQAGAQPALVRAAA
jgi:predicted NAD/FAD-binding protein